MTTLNLTISGASHAYDASPEQLAGLGQARSRVMSALSPGEGQTADTPLAERPGYIGDDVAYLQWAVQAWANQQSSPSLDDVDACIERAMTAYAGQPPTTEPLPEPLSPEASKAELVAYAAHKRWLVETGGCTWNGHTVQTDRDSQTKHLAEFVAIGAGLRTDPSLWKFRDGYALVSNADMVSVILAARTHIATAFGIEAAVLSAIDAGLVTTTAQEDLANWPG